MTFIGFARDFRNKNLAVWALVLCLWAWTAQRAGAEIQTIFLQQLNAGAQHFYVVKGSDVNLKNNQQQPIYNVVLVNVKSEKKVIGIEELPAGESVKFGFSKEGEYRLYYSFNPDKATALDHFVAIDVVPSRAA